jgi:ATP-dependent helicase/nuclease subunit A
VSSDPRLPFDEGGRPAAPTDRDEAARAFAVDPSQNVVLEASAGTGKTRVLVTRYVNLLRAGVDPANILAITFTRKAAAEMRERIVLELRELARLSPADEARWRALADRLGDIAISTIDAFCFSLLHEFPLEADLDPAFTVADPTELPRLVEEALDGALRVGRRLAPRDADVGLVLASLGERRTRLGLAALLDRRLVAGRALRLFLARVEGPSPADALVRVTARLRGLLAAADGGLDGFLGDGPAAHPSFALLEADLRSLAGSAPALPEAAARAAIDRVVRYFVTDKGEARVRPPAACKKDHSPSPSAWTRHSRAVKALAPGVVEAVGAFERDLNVAMVRGVRRLFRVARRRFALALEARAAVDFPEGLARALRLLRRMDEFAQSRYRLEARYHHVLVDEFQDTSRAQWRLVARLVESWGEGIGLTHDAPLQPSIFIVGDRKQSIYAFRDADVSTLRRARRHIGRLRPGGDVRRSIARSFRAAPELLAFANDLFASVDTSAARADAFRYRASDRFPVPRAAAPDGDGSTRTGLGDATALGLVVAGSTRRAAEAIAVEVEQLLGAATVRDRRTGTARPARPGDIAILFRSRESHRDIEAALDARRIPTYVYKGLGFFDADEVKDLVGLLRYLGDPSSDLRAAAFLRSRLVRVSDPALRAMAPRVAARLAGLEPLPGGLGDEDARVVARVQASLARWLPLVDRVTPAELIDRVIDEAAYAFELAGPRLAQARENVKKVRALARRLQNRGYATLARVADHVDRLSAGDESNAVVDALDAVNLMTVHAAKGLEFPFVFVVNLTRGTGGHGDPIVIVPGGRRGEPIVSVGGSLADADEAVRERDREETKRLLYVAVTRARERLYLSAVLKDGRVSAGPGSLAEVMPASLRDLLARAAASGEGDIEWRPDGGSAHSFRNVGPGAAPSAPITAGVAPAAGAPVMEVADFDPVRDAAGARRIGAAACAIAAGGDGAAAGGEEPRASAGAVVVGTLVHRLFQAARGGLDRAALTERARVLLQDEDAASPADRAAIVEEAVDAFLVLRERPDVAALLDTAACDYEVPFSMQVDDATPLFPGRPAAGAGTAAGAAIVVHGSIDCLARLPDGRIVVLEFKTGRQHEWHQRQLGLYVRAARALWPGAAVDGQLIYPELDAPGVPST